MSEAQTLPPLRKAPLTAQQQKQRVEMKKISVLTSKAIVSTSLKEKNDLLMEIMESWTPQIELFEKSQTLLEIKRSELAAVRKRLSAAQRERELLQRNTSFYQSGSVTRRKTAEDLIASITHIEEEIATHHPLPYPARLADAQRLPAGVPALFNYIDLNLHRLEELSYAYRKRLFVVEASQESEREVIEKHGSIQELIRKVEEYEAENTQFKEAEAAFLDNPVSKRRRFADMTPFCSRHFATLFCTMLRAESHTLAVFRNCEFPDHYDTSETRPVDSILSDPGFSCRPDVFDTAEFGNTTEPELIVPLVEGTDRPDKIAAYQSLVKKSEAVVKKLRQDITTSREQTVLVQDGGTSRADKLMTSNEGQLQRITALNRVLDGHHTQLVSQVDDIIRVSREKEAVSACYVNYLRDWRALMNSHRDLIWKRSQTNFVSRFLFTLATSCGRDILTEPSPTTPAAELLKAQFGVLILHLQEEDAAAAAEALALAQEAMQAEENESREPITAVGLLERMTAHRKHRRQMRTPLKLDTHRAVADTARPRPAFEMPRFFSRRPRFETIHGLAVACEAAGFLMGNDRPYRTSLDTFLRPFFNELLLQSKATVSSFGEMFIHRLSRTNLLAQSILVKTKESIETQTEVIPLIDEETQVGDLKDKTKPKKK
jgi:hypothetical protein